MQVIYVLGDEEFSNVCKIGRDSKWPDRFEQAQSHNPRKVIVHSIWSYSSNEELKSVERQVEVSLAAFKRTQTHGKEWYDLSPDDAVKKLADAGVFNGKLLNDRSPNLKPRELPYDDWRKQSDEYKGNIYKRILWVFQEGSPEKRFKVIHSPLYDTCYQYAFTYNPFPVHLVAAYHHPLMADGPSFSLRGGNEIVRSAWEHMVQDPVYGPGLNAVGVGWLKSSASYGWIESVANQLGLVPYDLAKPKPNCVRPNDGYGAKEIPYGSQPPMKRVSQARKEGGSHE